MIKLIDTRLHAHAILEDLRREIVDELQMIVLRLGRQTRQDEMEALETRRQTLVARIEALDVSADVLTH